MDVDTGCNSQGSEGESSRCLGERETELRREGGEIPAWED